MAHRETSAHSDRTDWQLAHEYLHRARYADSIRLAELFTAEEGGVAPPRAWRPSVPTPIA
ncbi:hypothetical protein AB0C98_41840 [Streptomyces sp. NPDC048558]|uniref:hypothetical protein n=1 Tax=Streptomyces sp. NPDC048558 TaxID=3155759 RepID=UPI003437EFA2